MNPNIKSAGSSSTEFSQDLVAYVSKRAIAHGASPHTLVIIEPGRRYETVLHAGFNPAAYMQGFAKRLFARQQEMDPDIANVFARRLHELF